MVTKYYGKIRVDWTDEEWARLTEVKRNRPRREPNDILKASARSLVSEAKRKQATRDLIAEQPRWLWWFDASKYHGAHYRERIV